LKDEYTRTHNKVIGKARFPSLLMQLWATDAIKTKTNVVKSFMKAGIFPLNRKSIDRSRIMKNSTANHNSSSTARTNTSNTSFNSQTNLSTSNSFQMLNNNSRIADNHQQMNIAVSSPPHIVSSFASSHDAISALDQVLKESALEDSDDDDDEDYIPNKSTSISLTTLTSKTKQQSRAKQTPTVKNQKLISPRRGGKRKKSIPKIIGINTSDEDGNLDSCIVSIIKKLFIV
jgi:hypothetical protein